MVLRDPKVSLLRHMVATVAYRGRIAISGAPDDFAGFRAAAGVRTPAEILAHLGDLLEGSLLLLQGELRYLNSQPLPWDEEVSRFSAAATRLDTFLGSQSELAHPVERFVQGPIGDALTHVGQMVMLRRMAGSPILPENYFMAEIAPRTPA